MAEFADLTDSERERLEMLVEECGEVIIACTKILRHGYDNHRPGSHEFNRNDLEFEIGDVLAIVNEMDNCGDISSDWNTDVMEDTWKKKLKWTHHQNEKP